MLYNKTMKKYINPKIKAVKLDADQAVLAVCRTGESIAYFSASWCYYATGSGTLPCNTPVRGRAMDYRKMVLEKHLANPRCLVETPLASGLDTRRHLTLCEGLPWSKAKCEDTCLRSTLCKGLPWSGIIGLRA